MNNSVEKWEKITWKKFSKECHSESWRQKFDTEADFGDTSPQIHHYYHGLIRRHPLVLDLYTCVYSGYPHPCPYIKLSMSVSNQKKLTSSQKKFVRVGFVFLLCINGFDLLLSKFEVVRFILQ